MAYMGLGDAVMFLPTLRGMREKFPRASINILTSRKSSAHEIFRISGCVDDIAFFDVKSTGFAERWKMNRFVANKKYDTVFCIHVSPIQFFIPALMRIPVRAGHDVPWQKWWQIRPNWIFNYGVRLLGFDQVHETERYLKLLKCVGVDTDAMSRDISVHLKDETIEKSRERIEQMGIHINDVLVGIHLNTSPFLQWKNWGKDKFILLSRELIKNHGVKIVLIGSEEEKISLRSTADEIGESAMIFYPVSDTEHGFSSIEETAGCIKRCSVVIDNDSGVGILSMACGTPTVRIFGMSDYWGVRSLDDRNIDVWKGLPCSPCFSLGNVKRGYSLRNCGHRKCLGSITVQDVCEAVTQIIYNNSKPV